MSQTTETIFKTFLETFKPAEIDDTDCQKLTTQEIYEMISSHSSYKEFEYKNVFHHMKKNNFKTDFDRVINEWKWLVKQIKT